MNGCKIRIQKSYICDSFDCDFKDMILKPFFATKMEVCRCICWDTGECTNPTAIEAAEKEREGG